MLAEEERFGHEYFSRRHLKNFSTPAHLFFLLEKHSSAFRILTHMELVHVLSSAALCCAMICGRGEIRTLEPIAQFPVFKTGAFDHSATLPVAI